MIRDKGIAKKISDLMIRHGQELNDSVALIKNECSQEEFGIYRKAIGVVMADMLFEVMNPIYQTHVDLKPEQLK